MKALPQLVLRTIPLLLLSSSLLSCSSPADDVDPYSRPDSPARTEVPVDDELDPLELDDDETAGDDGFELDVPEGFSVSTRPGPGGVEMVVIGSDELRADGEAAEVVAFEDPEATDLGGSEVQALSLKDLTGGPDVTLTYQDWPGAENASVLRWTRETRLADGTTVDERLTQLTVLTGDGRVFTALAVAPEDEFDDSGVLDVVRTLDVE